MPYREAISCRRSARASVAAIDEAGTRPVCRRPLMMASPMLPAPRKPTALSLRLMGDSGVRSGPRRARAEDRGADPHHGRALLDRHLVVGAHPHRAVLEPELVAQLAQAAEVRTRPLGLAGG